MRTFRAAVAKANKLGYAREFAFVQYKIPTGKPNKRALAEKDIDTILNHEKIIKDTDNYRMMAFCYFTVGMNYTDLCRLTWDNIRGNEIHYIRQKIHYKMIIPIHPKVREILDYYKPLTGNNPDLSGLNDNYVFQILNKHVHITEQQKMDRIQKKRTQFNKYLKTVGNVAKIETPLSSYVLRHSAITNLVRMGVTADAIQALAGHKRLSTTEAYIKDASNEQKLKAVNML